VYWTSDHPQKIQTIHHHGCGWWIAQKLEDKKCCANVCTSFEESSRAQEQVDADDK
jgi:hypothetical protein